MSEILQTILILAVLTGCKPNSGQINKDNFTVDTTNSANKNKEIMVMQLEKSNCDSLKFNDFKSNLQEIELKITEEFKNEVGHIAEDFIKKRCDQDTLYCDDIYLKDRKHYKSSLGYDLFSFAYAFINSEGGMEKESASFFVFGIKQNGKTIFYDISDDLIGEIQLKLSGFNLENNKIIIWGEMYPYFSSADYGKFKLTINGQNKEYEFQCKSHGH